MSFQMQSPGGNPFASPVDEDSKAKRQQSWRPPVAASPAGYVQGQGYANSGSTSAYAAHTSDSYFPPQASPPAPTNTMQRGQSYPQNDGTALAQQMGQIRVDGSAGNTVRKKKDRHAYHQLEQPAVGGMGAAAAPPGPHFLNGQAAGATQVQPQSGPSAQQPWQTASGAQSWQGQGQFAAAGATLPPAAGTPIPMAPASGAQQGPVGGQAKVNADQIPSVPLSRDIPAEFYRSQVYPTMEQHLPPPATTPFVAFDQGNASPKYARLTLNCIPTSHEQLASTGLPLGMLLQPLAKQADGENPIPVLDFGTTGPPRCRRCRAYINPFMIFSNGGNRMTCNLCGHPNEVPPEYFAPTDPSGVRVDRLQRPELTLGTCEFLVPKEYWSKEPVGMRYCFLIDVSAEACNRGFLQGVCDGILAALYADQAHDGQTNGEDDDTNGNTETKPSKVPLGAKVAFLTFDREVHFYNVSSTLSAPQQLVMSDLEDPFAAISSDHLFVDPAESKSNIVSLLKSIPQMFFNIKHAEPALMPSLQAALSALEITGGKIVCSLGSLPTYGPGRLMHRDKNMSQNDDNENNRNLLKTEHQGFRKLQADMVKAGVGVDFFLAAPSGGYMDIATIGFVAEKTGGETFYYPNWSYPRDLLRLEKEISHTVQRDQGYMALMKVRCSNGLQNAHYTGNFTQHTFGADLELATVTEDSGMCVTFSYDGKLDGKLDAHFQAALLYTTTSGQRRVRCSNIVASVSETARESMKFVDQDAVVGIIAKESAHKILDKSLTDVRQNVQDKAIDILAGYRKNFSGSHPTSQLVLPENLKEFSMYILGLMKSRAIKGGREPSDRRIHESRLIKGMGPAELSLYLYPRMLALHNLDPSEGFADDNGHLKLPRAIRASFSQIEEGGAYLVDNGQILLLWLHAQVSPNLLEDLFGEGIDDLQKLDPNLSALPVLETHLNAQVRNISLSLEQARGSKGLAIQLARQGLDGAEFEFARLLYEDRNGEASSYVDWLVMLHRGVGTELSGQRSKAGDDISHTITNTISGITANVPYWG